VGIPTGFSVGVGWVWALTFNPHGSPAECLTVGLACANQRRLTVSGSALEALRDDALYKSTYCTFTLFITRETKRAQMFYTSGPSSRNALPAALRHPAV